MAVSDTLINTLFDGRYRILRKLGSGGMANVYLAEDEELGRRVAIKILNDRYANDELFIERFRREAKSAAGLSHPNIVSIYDRGEAEGTYYIAMEVIEGRSLKELILTRGPLPIAQAVAYTLEMLEALRFAHRHGIIHRDIKPHNILIGERLKVTDFGIARAGASQMTEAGSIMGTAQYLSPEQARGAPVTASSDLYSVGIVLYEMLTGKVPFTGDSAIEIAMKHLNELPKPPSKIRPEVSEELDQVVLRALAKAPEDRYQTAEDFAEDLHRVEAGLPLAAATSEAATALLAAPGATIGGTTQVLPSDATQVAPPRREAPRRPPPYTPGYGYDERPPKRRRWAPWLLVLLLLAAAGFAGWYVFTKIQDQLSANATVPVPNVVGIERRLAEQKIEAAGLKPKVERSASKEVKAGIVISQNPDGGVRIQKGDQVTIVVSTGVPKTTVPDVVGMDYADAVDALNQAHLNARKREVFSKKPAGQVVAQNPAAQEVVPEDSTIVLKVSKGQETVSVPEVVGRSEADATAILHGAGFAVQSVSSPSDTTPQGIVTAQSPNAGTEATKGSTVTITVSSGPSSATVPNVVGEQEETARDDLENAGFKVKVEKVPVTDPTQDNVVQDQDPTGGSSAPKGSRVTIFVGQF
ncbi:MAG TPA: Stk1 family PASTA domain-containing Ser/Thr kinase [Gaiellaceae bacterium]|jgi:serine/threonine-protein kinase|nr:Stk1 family PASTA domain-containing Ser/Thr kinase [Gaiellaceae bacterium]